MPLFYQHNINEFTRLAIWKIEEDEDFFLARVPQKRQVTHPHKRLQHLAGRYLLPYLFSDFPLAEIMIADTRKPFLENERYHFSISHCGDYAAAIASADKRVGIDIELITEKIARVKEKFLHEREMQLVKGWDLSSYSELELLSMLWSVKESVFKWYGLGKIDFKEHIRLENHQPGTDAEPLTFSVTFNRESPISLNIKVTILGKLVLAWLDI